MNLDLMHKAAEHVRAKFPAARPAVSVVLGSGWDGAAAALRTTGTVGFDELPGLGKAQVAGHAGTIAIAEYAGKGLLIFHGRRHWYEGAGWEPVIFPSFLSAALGASVLVLTNAAGGIRPDLRAGDLMVIDDHINLMGANPLAGPHAAVLGPRFPDQTAVYDRDLRDLCDTVARDLGETLRHGVYLAVSGPAYETPAEIRAFRALGADAVGMSTVPEATVAHAAGLRVVAMSCIANPAAGVAAERLSHEDVIAVIGRAQPRLAAFLAELLRQIVGVVRP
jgi:purine-nucleoside phosphorylase